MNVCLRLFAGLHDVVGESRISMDLRDGATVRELRSRLEDAYPAVAPFLGTVVFAVDDEYIPLDQVLRDGDQVSVIPPISGGTGLYLLTRDVLDPQALVRLVQRNESGAVTLFYGVVRNNSEGHRVERLEYEAHETMALKKMREVGEETKARFPAITDIGAWHRVGTLEIGETSLLVAVSSPHRKEAFDACHWAVDRIKQVVPIWKKEHWTGGGAAWVAGHAVDVPEAPGQPAI